ncbi:MAG: GntR family transcriptional regulator [Verrucomicrobiaceae bacterium]|nr:MAG: GntR family transcriptional regulator [Verrucomicrobiaceae bacterium]
MKFLPQRISLTDQVVAAIRADIISARWTAELPSESELCRELQVSRVTLRRALAQLFMEKWIETGGKGRHHRILRVTPKPQAPPSRTIRILIPFPSVRLGSTEHDILTSVSERMEGAGLRTELESLPRVFENFRARTLADLDAKPDTAAWILFYSTKEIQQWFATCGRPTVVAGRVYNNLPLSSIYPDSEAAARHVAGLLHARGHDDVIYLIANLTSLNDRLGADTFIAEARRLGMRARTVHYEADNESLGKVLKNAIASKPRPTGYVIGASERSITVLCHLLAAGIRVPAEANVVSLWDDYSLSCTHPTIARYRTDGRILGKHIGKTLLDQLRHGTGKIKTIPVMPEFLAGGTLGTLRG